MHAAGVLGVLPGVPAITLHNPCLAYANGEEFMRTFHRAAAGEVDPFILVGLADYLGWEWRSKAGIRLPRRRIVDPG